MGPSVYLDYNATTPVDPRVIERMLPFFTEHYGNPASQGHAYGWAASAAVDVARVQVAETLGARPSSITFTSGASEAINMAVKGVARANVRKGRHIVTMQTEHKAMLNSCQALQHRGYRITYLPVNSHGVVDLDELEAAMTEETILVSVMWANNETGVLQPIREIASRVRDRGIVFMTDATQAVGKLPVTVEDIDVLVCSGHKLYGPKGVGALYLRERVRIPALLHGGGQERGLRAGTLNVPGIVGLGEAIHLAGDAVDSEYERQKQLRNELERTLCRALPGLRVNGSRAPRLPNTSSVTFPGKALDTLLPGSALGQVAISRGSACTSGYSATSHVLRAMGVQPEQARATARISLGRPTTAEAIRRAAAIMIDAVRSRMPAR